MKDQTGLRIKINWSVDAKNAAKEQKARELKELKDGKVKVK